MKPKNRLNIGYSKEEIRSILEEAIYGLGCVNPTAFAEIKQGETVLGSGISGGIDVFLSSKKVGSKGNVIGIDMTPDMVQMAERNANEYGYKNVQFKIGEIENLPIKENFIDVIISNCVINLTPNKLRANSEAFRVLRTGGRILYQIL